jgi:hypothetical protein
VSALTRPSVVSRIRAFLRIEEIAGKLNAVLIGVFEARAAGCSRGEVPMDAQRIAVDAVVALTGCDRDAATAFIRRLYLAGVKDPKRLTFKGLQALARG